MTFSEENYLKIIYHLGQERQEEVTTNAIAEAMQTKASSVTDMLKKLHEKGWVEHKKYQGVSLTKEGEKNALFVIRKHRLWEVFLVENWISSYYTLKKTLTETPSLINMVTCPRSKVSC